MKLSIYKSEVLISLIALILVTTQFHFCIAKSYFVSKNANLHTQIKMPTYNQILLALRYAEDGDTIHIDEGWYDNDFTEINKKIVIIGCQSSSGFRASSSQRLKETVISFTYNPSSYLFINASGVVIDGVKFGIENEASFGGIYINAAMVEIRNCLFAKNSGGNIYISHKGQQTKIQGNFLYGSENECILNNATEVVVAGNLLANYQDAPVVYSNQKITIKSNMLTSPANEKIVITGNSANLSFVAVNDITTTFVEENTDIVSVENTKEGLIPYETTVPNKLQSFFDNQTYLKINRCNLLVNNTLKLNLFTSSEVFLPDCGYLSMKGLSLKTNASKGNSVLSESFTFISISPNKFSLKP